jgi:hypothetical protein
VRRICGCRGADRVRCYGVASGPATRSPVDPPSSRMMLSRSADRSTALVYTNGGPSVRIDSDHPDETSQVRQRDSAPRFAARCSQRRSGRPTAAFGTSCRRWSSPRPLGRARRRRGRRTSDRRRRRRRDPGSVRSGVREPRAPTRTPRVVDPAPAPTAYRTTICRRGQRRVRRPHVLKSSTPRRRRC